MNEPRNPHRDADVPRQRPDDGTPVRPSRDDATASNRMEELRTGAAAETDGTDALATDRRDPEGGSSDQHRRKPHLTENDEDADVQDDIASEDDVPVLPASASGESGSRVQDHPNEVNDQSAYENRPEEDKDWQP